MPVLVVSKITKALVWLEVTLKEPRQVCLPCIWAHFSHGVDQIHESIDVASQCLQEIAPADPISNSLS